MKLAIGKFERTKERYFPVQFIKSWYNSWEPTFTPRPVCVFREKGVLNIITESLETNAMNNEEFVVYKPKLSFGAKSCSYTSPRTLFIPI